MFWCFDVLMFWCFDVLMFWCFDVWCSFLMFYVFMGFGGSILYLSDIPCVFDLVNAAIGRGVSSLFCGLLFCCDRGIGLSFGGVFGGVMKGVGWVEGDWAVWIVMAGGVAGGGAVAAGAGVFWVGCGSSGFFCGVVRCCGVCGTTDATGEEKRGVAGVDAGGWGEEGGIWICMASRSLGVPLEGE
jgi:hypothetical protein